MARIDKNVLLEGLKGSIGKQLVFRTAGGRTIISSFPNMKKVKQSSKQKHENSKFARANAWANFALKNPELYAFYKSHCKGGQRVNNVAIKDFYSPPEIHSVEKEADDKGNLQLLIHCSDNYKVAKVEVFIFSAEGVLSNGGGASEIRPDYWTFPLPTEWDKEGQVEVKAYDLTGNYSQCLYTFSALTAHILR